MHLVPQPVLSVLESTAQRLIVPLLLSNQAEAYSSQQISQSDGSRNPPSWVCS
jgi:hypothetical protein